MKPRRSLRPDSFGAALVRSLLKRLAGVDVIALLAIVGALVLREYLAGR
jgi:hypothetical protein